MNPKMINFLYKGSVILLVVTAIAAIIDATKFYDFGKFDVFKLASLATALWFILWQLKRNITEG